MYDTWKYIKSHEEYSRTFFVMPLLTATENAEKQVS